MTGLHSEFLHSIDWSNIPYPELNLGRERDKVPWMPWSIVLRANQYTCRWLVCWVLCSMLRRQGGEEERKSRRYNQSPVPVNKKLQSRSTWVNRKVSIQAKFKNATTLIYLSLTKVSVSRSRYWFPIQSSGFLFVEKVSVCLGTRQISKGKVK